MSELKVDKVSPRSGNYVALNTVGSKNIIINGDMSIAQRSTSTASITGNGYHTIDRMFLGLTGAGTWTQSQDTTVPTGQGFAKSLKMDCTTANGSLSAGDNCILQQRIEGQNLQYLKKGTASAESLTVSFWVYATKTGTNICELYDTDNTRQISQAYTISSSNTWEKKTLTFAGDTTGAFNNDNGGSLTLLFWLAAGSNFTSGTLNTSWNSVTTANRAVGQVNHADSTSNNFYITGIQMEAGTTASDFEFLPHDVNLQRCYRYFYKNDDSGGAGFIYVAHPMFNIQLPVTMRVAPSCTDSGGSAITATNATGQVTYTGPTSTSFSTKPNVVRLLYAGGTWSAAYTYGLGCIGYPTGLLISAEL